MTGPQDPAARRDQLRAGHADRERVIEALKTAFVRGQLTRDELGMRAGQALAARTGAELTALTADIPGGPAAAGPARRPAPVQLPAPVRRPTPVRRRPLARAAAGAGGCLGIAFAAVWLAAGVLDPDGLGNPYHPWSLLCLVVALSAVGTALYIVMNGVATSVEQRRSRRPPPARPAGRGPR